MTDLHSNSSHDEKIQQAVEYMDVSVQLFAVAIGSFIPAIWGLLKDLNHVAIGSSILFWICFLLADRFKNKAMRLEREAHANIPKD